MSFNFKDSGIPCTPPKGVKGNIHDDNDFEIIDMDKEIQSPKSVYTDADYEVVEKEESEVTGSDGKLKAEDDMTDSDIELEYDSDDDSYQSSEAESINLAVSTKKKELVPRPLCLIAHTDHPIRSLPIVMHFTLLTAYVPKQCVKKHPAFARIVGGGPLDLRRLTQGQGKIFVKFLEDDVYTPATHRYADRHISDEAEFEDAVKIHDVAVDMSLNKLADLAKGVLEEMVCQISLASVVHVFQDNEDWTMRNRRWIKKLLVRRGANVDGYTIGCDLQDNPASHDFQDPIVLFLMTSVMELKKRVPGSRKE
ncbi:hypothetical protein FHETE_2713 [Fusarium heterosporum]|uniref:Uncharacterized protein n=1 Tax=Fusarium heterosporum TaxID=42747 RepID=A0A8H5TV50_FUSHE|nr:hypothetical protein FHETE_2713 [Fusarium heterosporum]